MHHPPGLYAPFQVTYSYVNCVGLTLIGTFLEPLLYYRLKWVKPGRLFVCPVDRKVEIFHVQIFGDSLVVIACPFHDFSNTASFFFVHSPDILDIVHCEHPFFPPPVVRQPEDIGLKGGSQWTLLSMPSLLLHFLIAFRCTSIMH